MTTRFAIRPRIAFTAVLVLVSTIGLLTANSRVAQAGEPALPQSEVPADTSAEPALVVMFEPRQIGALAVVDAAESHLKGLHVRVIRESRARTSLLAWLAEGRRVARQRGALGLLAVDSSEHEGRVFLVEADSEPTLIRRLDLRPQSRLIAIEEAGIAVGLIVQSLLDGERVGMVEPVLDEDSAKPRAAAAPAESTAAARPSPSRANWKPNLKVGLVGSNWLSDAPWQLGVLTGFGIAPNPSWDIGVDYTWTRRFSRERNGVEVALARHPVRLAVSYRSLRSFSPVFSTGVFGDGVTRTTLGTDSARVVTDATTALSWGVSGGVGVVSPASRPFAARIDAGVELPVARMEYAVQNETRETFLSMRVIRPVVSVTLAYAP